MALPTSVGFLQLETSTRGEGAVNKQNIQEGIEEIEV